jgi:hypothetical protein
MARKFKRYKARTPETRARISATMRARHARIRQALAAFDSSRDHQNDVVV